MSFPISNNPGVKQTAAPKRKAVEVSQAIADASGMPEETFLKTDRNVVDNSVLQGKLAKKLGAKTKEVQVRTGGITLTGKALDKVRESGLKMATQTAGELSGNPIWTREGWNQVHMAVYDKAEGGKGQMDYTSPIVTDPNPKSNLLTEMTYLMTPGPGQK